MDASENIISVRNLVKVFESGIKILDGIDLDINKQERIVICGASGVGKSTFLRCLNLLDRPTSGDILFQGQSILSPTCNIHRVRQKMCMVFQQFNLFANLTVLENVTLAPVKLLSKTPEEARRIAFLLLEKFDLVDKANNMPSQLSGGQKQRASIIRALALDPAVMLFDEPTSALDPHMTSEIQSLINTLSKEGMTLVIITHDMQFADHIATRKLQMYCGQLFSA